MLDKQTVDSPSDEHLSLKKIALKLCQVPQHLTYNQYILTGYRHLNSIRKCLISVFHYHNETVNIWTHLLGALFFIVLGLYDRFYWLPQFNAPRVDYLILSIYCCTYVLCLLNSVFYHTFMCQDKESFEFCLQVDRFGISMAIYGSYIMAMHSMFYCEQNWTWIYLALSTTLFTLTKLLLFADKLKIFFKWLLALIQGRNQQKQCCHKNEYKKTDVTCCGTGSGDKSDDDKRQQQNAGHLAYMQDLVYQLFTKTTLYQDEDCLHNAFIVLSIANVVFGIIPIFHWAHDQGGLANAHVWDLLIHMFFMFLVGFLAVLIYVTRFPECRWPGNFDYIGASHQIWHVLVVLMLAINWHGLHGVYKYQHDAQTCVENQQYQFPSKMLNQLIGRLPFLGK